MRLHLRRHLAGIPSLEQPDAEHFARALWLRQSLSSSTLLYVLRFFDELTMAAQRTSAGEVFGFDWLVVSESGGDRRRPCSIQVPGPVPHGYTVARHQLVRMARPAGSSLEGIRP